MVGVALKMEIRKKEEEVIKRNVCQRKRILLGPKGKPSTYHCCGSEYHFIGNCDKRKKEAKIVENGSEGEAEDGFS